jgi:hypothetical protein
MEEIWKKVEDEMKTEEKKKRTKKIPSWEIKRDLVQDLDLYITMKTSKKEPQTLLEITDITYKAQRIYDRLAAAKPPTQKPRGTVTNIHETRIGEILEIKARIERNIGRTTDKEETKYIKERMDKVKVFISTDKAISEESISRLEERIKVIERKKDTIGERSFTEPTPCSNITQRPSSENVMRTTT